MKYTFTGYDSQRQHTTLDVDVPTVYTDVAELGLPLHTTPACSGDECVCDDDEDIIDACVAIDGVEQEMPDVHSPWFLARQHYAQLQKHGR